MKLTEDFKRLAGLMPRTHESWRLEEAVRVGDEVVAIEAGADTGKRGTVVGFDGDWADVRGKDGSQSWLPLRKLNPVR